MPLFLLLLQSSESETSDEEKLVKKIGSSLDSDWDSDEWDVPLAKIKQLTKGIKVNLTYNLHIV